MKRKKIVSYNEGVLKRHDERTMIYLLILIRISLTLTASATIRNPQTFNRYAYPLNSPYKFTDPLGLLPTSWDTRYGGDSGFCSASNASCEEGEDITTVSILACQKKQQEKETKRLEERRKKRDGNRRKRPQPKKPTPPPPPSNPTPLKVRSQRCLEDPEHIFRIQTMAIRSI